MIQTIFISVLLLQLCAFFYRVLLSIIKAFNQCHYLHYILHKLLLLYVKKLKQRIYYKKNVSLYLRIDICNIHTFFMCMHIFFSIQSVRLCVATLFVQVQQLLDVNDAVFRMQALSLTIERCFSNGALTEKNYFNNQIVEDYSRALSTSFACILLCKWLINCYKKLTYNTL